MLIKRLHIFFYGFKIIIQEEFLLIKKFEVFFSNSTQNLMASENKKTKGLLLKSKYDLFVWLFRLSGE